MPYLEPCARLVLLAVPWPAVTSPTRADARGVQAVARTEIEDATDESPLDRPTLPLTMAVALACVVLLAWALAPFGWRGH